MGRYSAIGTTEETTQYGSVSEPEQTVGRQPTSDVTPTVWRQRDSRYHLTPYLECGHVVRDSSGEAGWVEDGDDRIVFRPHLDTNDVTGVDLIASSIATTYAAQQ
jgi:hypothetical protein